MADSTTTAPDLPPDASAKPRLRAVMLALVAALVLGGGGFLAVYQGWLLGPGDSAPTPAPMTLDFDFIAIDSMTISLVPGSGVSNLQFAAQIEVPAHAYAEVMRMHPRFVDVINTYLRAVNPQDLAEAEALFRLRAQILRRLQTIAGQGNIRDFLITEFVLR
ncbi:MAG: flagellar basal body-associated FliL family protein [Rhodobacteraceae bacterium]|nr:flagellar basal body-associated FliL family protein [Paracoccaceae bacterium]